MLSSHVVESGLGGLCVRHAHVDHGDCHEQQAENLENRAN